MAKNFLTNYPFFGVGEPARYRAGAWKDPNLLGDHPSREDIILAFGVIASLLHTKPAIVKA